MGSDSDRPARVRAASVEVRFGAVAALADAHVELREGTITGLIGPNGAGKSTFINVLSGFQAVARGRVRLDGSDITSWSPGRRARAGLVRTFQGNRSYRDLTVRDNVAASFAVRGHRMGRALRAADEILADLGLTARAGVPASALTAGEERRLGLARAIGLDPRVLLLDEPAAGLNETESDELLADLSRIRAERDVAMMIVEHDMRLIMRLCDVVCVLDAGRITASGTPEAVSRDPAVLAAYLGQKGDQVA